MSTTQMQRVADELGITVEDVRALAEPHGDMWTDDGGDLTPAAADELIEGQRSHVVGIDVLTDCHYAGQAPADFTDDDDLEGVNERFIELAAPHFEHAGSLLGYTVVVTRDARKLDEIRRGWNDDEAYRQAWQAIHDAVNVDLGALARQALREAQN